MNSVRFHYSAVARHYGCRDIGGCRIAMDRVEMFRSYEDLERPVGNGGNSENDITLYGILFVTATGKYKWVYPDKESRDLEYAVMCKLHDVPIVVDEPAMEAV